MSLGTSSRWRRVVARQFTLGGSLSILNGFFWVCIFVGSRHLPEWAFNAMVPLLLVLAFPIAIPCLFPSLGGPTVPDIVVIAVGIGINSLVWGHGLAWLIRRVMRRFG